MRRKRRGQMCSKPPQRTQRCRSTSRTTPRNTVPWGPRKSMGHPPTDQLRHRVTYPGLCCHLVAYRVVVFFEPFQLHLEPSDLLEQLGLGGLGVGGGGLARLGEDLVGALQQLLLPAVDEGGVDPELGGQLVD